MSNFVATLWITLIGMGLVFVALILLWGLMEATVKGTAWYNKRHPEVEEEVAEEEEVADAVPAIEDQPAPTAIKQQAAAAAVAVALALRSESPEAAGQLPVVSGYSGQPSAWQTVMRSAQLTQRSNQFTRKSRGNVR